MHWNEARQKIIARLDITDGYDNAVKRMNRALERGDLTEIQRAAHALSEATTIRLASGDLREMVEYKSPADFWREYRRYPGRLFTAVMNGEDGSARAYAHILHQLDTLLDTIGREFEDDYGELTPPTSLETG